MKENQEQIDYCNILTANTREVYDKIGSIFCPCLKENVTFNAKDSITSYTNQLAHPEI